MNRDFKGVWVPKEIWLNAGLTLQEKMLLVEINSFDVCFASNAHFSEFLGLSERRVKQLLTSLRQKNYIESVEQRKGNITVKRTIKVNKVLFYGVDGEISCPTSGNILPEVGEISCPRTNTVTNTTTIRPLVEQEKPAQQAKPKFTQDHLNFAQYMFDCIRELNPNQRQANIESWANDLRLITDIDKRSYEDVSKVWEWVRKDPFWQSNILSPKKLRKQFDQLVIKMKFSKPTMTEMLTEIVEESRNEQHRINGNHSNAIEGNLSTRGDFL